MFAIRLLMPYFIQNPVYKILDEELFEKFLAIDFK
jgi:hypothetical protein